MKNDLSILRIGGFFTNYGLELGKGNGRDGNNSIEKKDSMKRILLVCLLVAGLLLMVSCRGGTSKETTDATAIEDTIRGYVTTYNAGNFTHCLTYFADYGDEGDALAFLSYMRSLLGPLELREIKDIAIYSLLLCQGAAKQPQLPLSLLLLVRKVPTRYD